MSAPRPTPRPLASPIGRLASLLIAAALATSLATPATAEEGPARTEKYVALGDSAAAGPVIVPQQADQPLPCLRSKRNFPTLVAEELGVDDFTDATCSGAETTHLWEPQLGAPPQLDALTRDTTLVTLGPIGANDADIVTAVLGCLVPGCAARDGDEGHERIEATRPKVSTALAAIKKRAPRAEIVMVGYGEYLPAGGCPLRQPITRTDADHVRGLTNHMSRVLREEAKAHGATFVSLADLPDAAKHTTCAAPGQRWLEGAVPLAFDGSVPFHPTALGMEAFAEGVTAAVSGERPAQE